MTDSSLDPKANLSGYERCTMLETLAISLSRANMTLRVPVPQEPERPGDFYCESSNDPFSEVSQMKDSEILAHAEALANGQCEGDRPTESDFERAEREIREMVADGATYDQGRGWVWPE